MFWTRLFSGIILVAVALLTICSGGIVLFATIIGVSVIGVQELYRAMGVRQDRFQILELAGYAGVLLYYGGIYVSFEKLALPALLGSLVLLMCVYVFTYPRYHADQIMAAYFGIIYVAVMLSFIYLTRALEGGTWHVWLIFLCSWGCDTCAYCVGVLIGKHKMAPVLSPKKSVEGAIGGVIGAVILGLLFGAVSGGNIKAYGLICGVGALISMVGDLAASAIKRNRDIKDYGKLIPGHGGILDRFDSVIFTAPIIYYLSVLMM